MYLKTETATTGNNIVANIKDLTTNQIDNELSSTTTNHAHITPDGNYFAYDSKANGFQRVFARNISTNQRASVRGGRWDYGGGFWQQDNNSAFEPQTEAVISNSGAIVNFTSDVVEFSAYGSQGAYPLQYLWDFGDGTNYTSDEPVAEHNYANPGDYTVELTVIDDLGNTSTTTFITTVLPPMNDMPSIRSDIGQLGVTFDTISSNPNLDFRWDFGDGNGTVGPVVSHQYEDLDTYLVNLQVMDLRVDPPRLVLEDETTVTMWDKRPTAYFEADMSDQLENVPVYVPSYYHYTISGRAPFMVNLDASGTQGQGDLSYHWDFGDGNTAEGVIVQHTYEQKGFYLITLTVKTEKGLEDTAHAFASVYPFWESNDIRYSHGINIFPHMETLPQFSNNSALSTANTDSPDVAFFTNHHTIDSYSAGMKVRARVIFRLSGQFSADYPDDNPNWYFHGTGAVDCSEDSLPWCTTWRTYENFLYRQVEPIIAPISPSAKTIHQNFLLNNESLTITVHLFQGIRVPRVYVGIFPDHLIPGDVPTPFGADTVDPETNTLIHSIIARESDISDNKVTADVPVYAVDGNGDLMTDAVGYFGAVFDYEGSHCGDCVMINGRASITVDIPVDGNEAIDLSTVLFGNYGNGTGRFLSPPAKTVTCHSNASHRVEYPTHVEFDDYDFFDNYDGRCITFTTTSEIPRGLIDPDNPSGDGLQAPTTFNFNNQGMFDFSNVKVLNAKGKVIGTASLDTAQLFGCSGPCAWAGQLWADQSRLVYSFWENAWEESPLAVQFGLAVLPVADGLDIYFHVDDCATVDINQNAYFSCVIVGAAVIALAADTVPAVGATLSFANRFLVRSLKLLGEGVGGAFIKAAVAVHERYAPSSRWLIPPGGIGFPNWLGYVNDMSAYMGTFINLVKTNGVRNLGKFIDKADIVAMRIAAKLGIQDDPEAAIKLLDDALKDGQALGVDAGDFVEMADQMGDGLLDEYPLSLSLVETTTSGSGLVKSSTS